MSYDIIGDIHGHSQSLESILVKLGYKNQSGIYRHPSRKVIFLGDFIDRGDYQREVIDIVRAMTNAGSALAVMGNHEFNAIAYYTDEHEGGGYLRPHSEKNTGQHQAFLDAYKGALAAYDDAISWFKTLPLWLDLGDLKVIHACRDAINCAQGAFALFPGTESRLYPSHGAAQPWDGIGALALRPDTSGRPEPYQIRDLKAIIFGFIESGL